jgi:small ligand-binding sensory domain FIST
LNWQTAPHKQITSGSSFGAFASDEHARRAVQAAIKKITDRPIGGVLLFLTTGYALYPQTAIRAAVKVSGTLNVTGCCALGVFTEQDSSTDREGAVAMAFSHEAALSPLLSAKQGGRTVELCLSLSSPNAGKIAIQSANIKQFGAIASDEFGEGPYSLWQGGRIVEREYCHNVFAGSSQHFLAKCESVRPLSPLMQINLSDAHELIELDQRPALDSLNELLPAQLQNSEQDLGLSIIALVSETSDPASINLGHHQLLHVVSIDKATRRVMLSEPIKAGRRMLWAIRDPQYAEQQMRLRLLEAKRKFSGQPTYALMFININRGTDFYQGHNRDLRLFAQIFPDTVMVGISSHAEIIPGYRSNASIQHSSTVFGLFS